MLESVAIPREPTRFLGQNGPQNSAAHFVISRFTFLSLVVFDAPSRAPGVEPDAEPRRSRRRMRSHFRGNRKCISAPLGPPVLTPAPLRKVGRTSPKRCATYPASRNCFRNAVARGSWLRMPNRVRPGRETPASLWRVPRGRNSGPCPSRHDVTGSQRPDSSNGRGWGAAPG